MAGPVRFGGQGGDDPGQDGLGLTGVAVEVGDDHIQGHVGLVDLPAVVVGDHGQGGIGDLGFAGALGFAQVGHADHLVAVAVVGQRFSAGAEGGSLHVHVGAAIVNAGLLGLGRLVEQLA